MKREKFQELLKFRDSLVAEREHYEDTFKEICEYVLPLRYNWEWDDLEGDIERPTIYDSTAVDANRILADGYQGYMVNPRSPWIHINMEDQRYANDGNWKKWLPKAEKGLYRILARSNFYGAIGQVFLDSALGTTVMYIEKDDETIVNFMPQHLRGIYISENASGRVDTVFHKMRIPNRDIARMYEKTLPEQKYKEMMESPFKSSYIWRAVLPNEEYKEGALGPDGFPFASITFLDGEFEDALDERGYNRFPYVVWRPIKSTGESYGRSSAWYSLGDILRLNQLEKDMLEVAHLSAKPPLNVPGEQLEDVNLTPWGINPYTDASRYITPIQVGANFPYGVEEREQLRNQIKSYFQVDAFQLLSMMADKEYTATQAAEMAGEKSAQLTALTARVGSELLDPTIEIVLAYGIEAGEIPAPPGDLSPSMLKVDYIGPLTMDQERNFRTSGILRGMNQIGPYLEMKPDIWDLIKDDDVFRELLEGSGMPNSKMRSRAEVEEIRAARAQQAAQQQQIDNMKAQAQAYKDGSYEAAQGSLSKEMMGG